MFAIAFLFIRVPRDCLAPLAGTIANRNRSTFAPHPEVLVPAFAAWPAALRRRLGRHAPASATANSQLAFHPDHSMRADQGPPPTLLATTDKVTSADTLGLKLELTKARTINLDRQEGRTDPAAREA
jgi:hypothetical protein